MITFIGNIKKEYTSHNILSVSLNDTGILDHKNSTIFTINLIDEGGSMIEVNGQQFNNIELKFTGHSEREQLYDILETALYMLRNNNNLPK